MADDPTSRAWKSNRDSQAGVFIDDKKAVLAGNGQSFVVADKAGITIKGPVSFVTGSEQIRVGGLFTGNNDFMQMIPSTIVTPLPARQVAPPVTGLTFLVQDLAFFAALLV